MEHSIVRTFIGAGASARRGFDQVTSRLPSLGRCVWRITGAFVVVVLIVFIVFVVERNAGAARARREAPLPPVKDIDPAPENFTTQRLPRDDRLMCSVGNGHVATNVFSDSVFMNGLYSGAEGRSHRARIPAWANVRLNSTLGTTGAHPLYSLRAKHGTFIVHVDREWSTVEQRIYAHRYYTRAIVNQIIITAKHHADVHRQLQHVELSYLPGVDSKDVEFEQPSSRKIGGRIVWTSCGLTTLAEDPRYQEHPTEVCACWTDVPTHLVVPRRGRAIRTFTMTVDGKKTVALKEMADILNETGDHLFEKHKEEWRKIYDIGRIEISGNLELEKTVNAAWYYILSSLPSFNSNQQRWLFYGLSPGGLSRGDLLKDYEGHNFWDTEIWMFPTILLLQPQYAELLLRYRIAMMFAATNLANDYGYQGIRFPWESAFTGREVTQPCCPEVAIFEHHITGCIAFAARQYIAVTGDQIWLKNGGCALIKGIAEFWFSRAVFNNATRYYDIQRN